MRTLALALLLAAPAAADEPAPADAGCASREQAVAALARAYGETVAGRGITPGGLLMELWTGPSGSWTVTVTRPDGLTCFMSAGQAWEPVTRPVEGSPV